MSSVKQYLKSAKRSIEANEPEDVLEYVDEILSLDKQNYFAYIFQGKAYQLLNALPKARESFRIATDIEPENLLGWKGYLQVAKVGTDYKLFFHVVAVIVRLQIDQGISTGEVLKDVNNYLHLNNYKSDDELYEEYLWSIIPGSELGQMMGSSFGKPEANLISLIELISRKLKDFNSKAIAKERVKYGRVLSADQKFQLQNLTYNIYKDSKLECLYTELLNISNDEDTRLKYQEEFLKYKYEIILKGSSNKQKVIAEVKDMVEGMILIKSKSLYAWTLYFDWLDPKTIGDIPIENVIFFLNTFSNEGLAQILFAYAMSDISQFDRPKIVKEASLAFQMKVQDSEINGDNDEPSEVSRNDEETNQEFNLLPDQVLTLMLEGYSKSKTSVISNRIICGYYIHIREYNAGSLRCHDSIRLLADFQRTIGIDLTNTKEDLLCSLAIIYTYYEAPKNFPRALQLYDRILETNKDNAKAKFGKALILIEKNDFESAITILRQLTTEYPDYIEALSEYNWCLIKLNEFEKGRLGLESVLQNIKGSSMNDADSRAVIHWRIAKSFILETDSDSEKLKLAYTHLITSLKENQNYAPSYSLLGFIYKTYYMDNDRATKCFYKAFELDVNEIAAAKHLVEDLTNNNEWEVAEILCNKIIKSETARRTLLSKSYDDDDKSWPYRVLGSSCLNKQDDAAAVQWFQTALRMTNINVQSWLGLGEAYYNCGRLDAAAKVFRHILSLGEESWLAIYLLGRVLCEMGEFDEGLSYLQTSLELQPQEECILSAIYEGYIAQSLHLIQQGYIGRSLEANVTAIKYLRSAQKVNGESQIFWKSINDCLRIYLIIQDSKSFPIDIFEEIFSDVDLTTGNNFLVETYNDDPTSNFMLALDLYKTDEFVQSLLTLMIISSKAGIKYLPNKVHKFSRSIMFYNLGLSYLEAFNRNDDSETYRTLSIKYLKKAIQLENNNASFWIALGTAYISHNPQISQHCYIKAISLESRDAGIWTNLAALYLRYGDVELAQEAFARAQSVAPQESKSWLGNALTSEVTGNSANASHLFTHAYIVSNGRSPLAQMLYGLAIIKKRKNDDDSRNIEAAQEFSVANFAMQKYLQYLPQDEFGLAIALAVSERCKNFEFARTIGERLCTLFEKQYEKTESELVLLKFAKSKTQLARIYLGLEMYDEAIEAAEFALNIVESEEEKVTLSSRIVIGLGLFFKGEFDQSLQVLQTILETHHSSRRIVSLVAQVLNAHGSEDTKQAALDQLFTFIEQHGSSLLIVLVLGAISVVDNLEDYFIPVKDELKALSLEDTVNDSFKLVPKLLNEINDRLSTNDSIWEKQAMMFPGDYNVWVNLNNSMAVAIGELRQSKVTTDQLSRVYYDSGILRNVQRSLFLSPSNESIQQTLSQF
jgi:superkiller protein 3